MKINNEEVKVLFIEYNTIDNNYLDIKKHLDNITIDNIKSRTITLEEIDIIIYIPEEKYSSSAILDDDPNNNSMYSKFIETCIPSLLAIKQ